MDWYYLDDRRQQHGPLPPSDLRDLHDAGLVGDQTLVWHDGMGEWAAFSSVADHLPGGDVDLETDPTARRVQCAVTGRWIPQKNALRFEEQWISPAARDEYFERLIEGVAQPHEPKYAGFWIRVAAKIIDNIIVGIVATIMMVGSTVVFVVLIAASNGSRNGPSEEWMIGLQLVLNLLQYVLDFTYATFFVGKYGATPGKMLLKMKIVRPDGSRVGYWRALGRKFGEMISFFVLLIGYLVVAFDSEKRGLHDRLADTRVVMDQKGGKAR